MDKFVFKSELWVAQNTGVKVNTLDGFRRAISEVDEDTLYYHFYRSIFEFHFLIPTYSNDFAFWFSDNGLPILAEKMSIIDPLVYTSLGDVRAELSRVLQEAGEDRRRFKTPFYFQRAIRDVVELGMEADSVSSFIEMFESIGVYCLFYHLVTARLRLGESTNDFSQWLRAAGREETAKEIESLNPWMFSLYDMKAFILDVLKRKRNVD
ncbi:MAG: DUF5752 family protein [Syntrophales bacterium]